MLTASAQAQDSAVSPQPETASQAPAQDQAGESVATNIPNGYALVWSDEFSTPGLPDPAKWKYDTFRNKQGWFNNEKQYYSANRAENARIESGNLIIEARKEALDPALFPDWGGQEFSSARLITQGLGDWTYGFFEIRAKLPCGVGTWPAIWMLPSDPDIEWPEGGEIDIMEHVGFEPGVIHHSVHTTAFNFSRGTQMTSKHELESACDAMHKYQLLWTSDFMMFGVDDKPKFLFKKESSKRSRWPFDRPQHLLLNIAIGGSWGGQKGIADDAVPARMEIDYVRVYQPTAPAAQKGE
ncbi:glycoside hydrolase family 16 protein [Alterisphingorhabdus coralli]|uniref:Glycoside hydrolase family 16 protein n=1 Tax=Alterisphingorhabdus coralli TaxID=3071408 RepID=A0AA97I0Z7_9SPHN|nr:glycoside hydrolase family 16 protein [Parasphingorhabdus sp. SCSIO 66989]WOE75527.1 glycoside hydrolase family 16 protein [Parasphingorhabdus sp. SCSIO 66989]